MAPLVRNATLLFLTEAAVRACNLGILLAVARILPKESFGILVFAYTLAETILIVPAFGFESLLVRDLARKPGRAGLLLSHVFALRALGYLPAAGLCLFLASRAEAGRGETLLVALIFLAAAANQALQLMCVCFRARQAFGLEGRLRFLAAIGSLGAALGVLLAGGGLAGVILARMAITGLAAGAGLLLVFRLYRPRLVRPRRRTALVLLRRAAPLAALLILVQLYLGSPGIVLGLLSDQATVADFGAAQRILILLLMAAASLSSAAFPALAADHAAGGGTFRATLRRALAWTIALALPLSLGLLFLGKECVLLLFGTKYPGGGAVLGVLALCLLPDFLNHILAVALIAANRNKGALLGALAGAAVALGASVPFIAWWQARGAALAMAAAMGAACAVQLFFLRGIGATGRPSNAEAP